MKNKSLLRTLIIPYIAVMIFWNYRVYVNYTGIWNYLYVWDVWDTIRYTFIDIIVIEVISLAVRYAEKHIIKYGETRDIFVDDVTEIIRGIYKWINKGFNLLFGIIGIVAIVKIVNGESNYGIIREFLINIRPVLLWMPIQEIVKSICNLFADKIDEDEVEKEKNEEAIEEKSKIELQNEQTEEYDSQKENACDEEKNDADIMESEEKIQELNEKKSNSTAIVVGVIIVGVLVLLGALLMRSCAGNASFNGDTGKSTSGSESTTEKEEYTLEEYLSNCIVVDTETIGRNPDKYIGMDVLIEDKFTNIGSTLSVGFARTRYPMQVEYDDVAYDLELNPVGNVMSGDFGFVAGKCTGEDSIRAEIIVLYEEGKGSYEQIITPNATSKQETQNVKENTGTESNEVANMEEPVMQSYDMYEYMFSEEEGKTPVDFFINAGMGYEMEPTGRGCEYYSTDIDAWFTSDADYVECYVSGDNSRDYGVTLYGLYIGLEENEVYSFFEVENQGDDSLTLWTEDEAGYLEISFDYGKVSELHFYYSYE